MSPLVRWNEINDGRDTVTNIGVESFLGSVQPVENNGAMRIHEKGGYLALV